MSPRSNDRVPGAKRTFGLVHVLPGLVTAENVVHLLALQRHLLLHLLIDLEQVRTRLAEEAHAVGLRDEPHTQASDSSILTLRPQAQTLTSGSTSRMLPQHGQKCMAASQSVVSRSLMALDYFRDQ